MEKFSASLTLCESNPPVTSGLGTVMQNIVFLWGKLLNKQPMILDAMAPIWHPLPHYTIR